MTVRPPDPPSDPSPYPPGSAYVPPPAPGAVPPAPAGWTTAPQQPSAPPPAPVPPPYASAPPVAGPDIGGALSRLGQGEILVLAGSVLVLVVAEGIGRLLTNTYGVNTLVWVAALFLIIGIAQRASGRVPLLGLPYATVIVVLAAIVGVVAVHELLTDLRFFRSPDAANLLMRLAFYAGAAMVAFGGYVVWRTPGLRR